MKPNADIRKVISDSDFFTWEIAQQLGIHENTFYRWMRTEMSSEKKEMVMDAISEINKEGITNG